MRTAKTLGSLLITWGVLSASAAGGTRVFMASDVDATNAPTTGNTSVVMTAGTTATISMWLEDDVQLALLNGYQVIARWQATPLPGASGTVTYRDNAAPPGAGDSIAVSFGRADYVFSGEGAESPSFNETPSPPAPAGSAGFGAQNSLPGIGLGIPVVGIKYLADFAIDASPDACGAFELAFVPIGVAPAGGTAFVGPNGVEFPINEFQKLTVLVGATVVPPGDMCLTTLNFSDTLALPADFFGPGSSPFGGSVGFLGSSSNPFDTTIHLNSGAIFCGLPGGTETVDIELVQLQLLSVAPINVDGNLWSVRATLSANGPPPSGSMDITTTSPAGGTFNAAWSLQPRYTFTRIDNPALPLKYWDTGSLGLPAKQMQTVGEIGWSTPGTFTPNVPNIPEQCLTALITAWDEANQCCDAVLTAGQSVLHNVLQVGCDLCGGGGGQPASGACCSVAALCQVVAGSDACPGPNTYFGDGTTCDDNDGDGIPNVLETNDCIVGPCSTGTNPANPDTDGDGCTDGADADPCDPCVPFGGCGLPVPPDCNGNGTNDAWEAACNQCPDCDGNGVCRECDLVWCCIEDPNSGPLWLNTTVALCQGAAPGLPLTIYDECCNGPEQDSEPIPEGSVVFNHVIGQPGVCPATCDPVPAPEGPCAPPFIDPWRSGEQDGATAMCEDFFIDPTNPSTQLSPPLPVNFFGQRNGADSDLWVGKICFQGDPLSPPKTPFGDFGNADTLIVRTLDPFDRCALPAGPQSVSVEIVALSLIEVAPINVTWGCDACATQSDPAAAQVLRNAFCANPPPGGICEQWNVDVGLSPTFTPPPGTLTATKAHCNGGTYFNTLLVQALLTFSKVGAPAVTATLDTAEAGIPPVELEVLPANARPWSSDVDPTSGFVVDECSDFHAGIDTLTKSTNCDCNNSLKRDLCDIEDGDSFDCNLNNIPDECEIDLNTPPLGSYFCAPGTGCDPDCNTNGIPDACETDCNANGAPDDCDITAMISNDCQPDGIPDDCQSDCNGNGVADGCDIAGASADCNSNGTPDECEPDCNGNSIADSCEITAGTLHDFNANGVPDVCESVGCFNASSCCDVAVADGIRDDGCVWCACNSGVCSAQPLGTFADMGGAFGACAPDGFSNVHDRNHALTCFSGENPCDDLNVDAGGAFGACEADGFCNVHDANHALTGFAGTNLCSCSPSPAASVDRVVVGRAQLEVRTERPMIRPARTVRVRVLVKAMSSAAARSAFSGNEQVNLQSYQLHLAVSGGRRGILELVDITIEPHKQFVFRGRSDVFDAFNTETAQMIAGLDDMLGVAGQGDAYLATYTYRASPDAAGQFVVDVLHDESNGDQTYLVAAHGEQIVIESTTAAAIRVTPLTSVGAR